MEHSKASRRTEARARRALLTRADFAERIARFAADLALAKNAIVAGYDPIRDEADPRALMSALAALGHPLALPCVGEARSALVFRIWNMCAALRRSRARFAAACEASQAPCQAIPVP